MAADKEIDDLLIRFRKMSKPVRVVYARPRVFISMVFGIAAFLLLPGSLRLVTRLLISWDIFVALYLVLVYAMMLRSGLKRIRRNAALQDDGRFLILLVTGFGAFASLAAIIFELGASQRSPPQLGLATLTIALQRRHPRARRLLGFRVFLVRDRHDRAGLRRRHHQQEHPPHRHRARHHLVFLQYRALGADGQYRGERDLNGQRRSGAMRSIEPGTSRFSDVQLHIVVRCFASPRNDEYIFAVLWRKRHKTFLA
jgi:hypothetical protein